MEFSEIERKINLIQNRDEIGFGLVTPILGAMKKCKQRHVPFVDYYTAREYLWQEINDLLEEDFNEPPFEYADVKLIYSKIGSQ